MQLVLKIIYPITALNEVSQWRVDNARYIFETEFHYVITAVNEDFSNSDNFFFCSKRVQKISIN